MTIKMPQLSINKKVPSDKVINTEKSKTPPMSMKIGESKRLTLTYAVLVIWISLAIFGVIVETDLYALAVYFASGLPLILGYLWSETSRPTIKDAAQVVKNINSGKRYRRNDYYDGYDNDYFNSGYRNGRNYNRYNDYGNDDVDINNNQNTQDTNIEISIFSDDSAVELKANEEQLDTLMNTGYVDSNGDVYTFKKNELEQVKSLISTNDETPEI